MTARELLTELKQKGVDIKANGDRLVIDAPKGAITPELRTSLTEHKSELLTILRAPSPEQPAPRPKASSLVSERPVETPPPIAPQASSSVAEEIKTLEQELERLRAAEVGRRAEVETERLAAEHAFQQERDRFRQEQEAAARRRAEHEKLRIEAEARERAAEETRRRIAEDELARVEEELKRMRAMEESRRVEVEAQFQAATVAHDSELERIRAAEAEQTRARAEEEH